MLRKKHVRSNLGTTLGVGKRQKIQHTGVLSNYCGPGGSGTPRHPTDQACKEHDDEYGKMDDGPYFHYNAADQELVHKLKARRDQIREDAQAGRMDHDEAIKEAIINESAQVYFQSKKHIAPKSNKYPPRYDTEKRKQLTGEKQKNARQQMIRHNRNFRVRHRCLV